MRDGKQVTVPIEIGATSETNSEVISDDIQDGAAVILNPTIETNLQMQMGAGARE